MIRVKILPGKAPGTETVVFFLSEGTLRFPSHVRAREWQFFQIFGDSPDFSALEGHEESYINEIFDLENDFNPRLVTGEPCRIAHLQRLAESLGRKVDVSNYLVTPKY